MKKTAASLAAALCAALVVAAAAGAATISDLQAEGFSVGVARTYDAGACTVYAISGWGVDVTADSCDPGYQAQIDSLADPVAQCNRAWQVDHPDQLAALGVLNQHGYATSGDQCADAYTVQNATTGAVVYSGPGAGLVDAAASLPDLTLVVGAPSPSLPTTGPAVPVVQTCLPLCPAPPVAAPAPAPTADAPAAQTPSASVTDAPSQAALADATDAGSDPALAALAARSAGLNATYDL